MADGRGRVFVGSISKNQQPLPPPQMPQQHRRPSHSRPHLSVFLYIYIFVLLSCPPAAMPMLEMPNTRRFWSLAEPPTKAHQRPRLFSASSRPSESPSSPAAPLLVQGCCSFLLRVLPCSRKFPPAASLRLHRRRRRQLSPKRNNLLAASFSLQPAMDGGLDTRSRCSPRLRLRFRLRLRLRLRLRRR